MYIINNYFLIHTRFIYELNLLKFIRMNAIMCVANIAVTKQPDCIS